MQHREQKVLHHEITNEFIANWEIYNIRGGKERHKVIRYQIKERRKKWRDIRSILIPDLS